MILLDTKTPLRWTPPWRDGEEDAPVYLIRAGSVADRAMFEAELAGEHQAGQVYAPDVAAAALAGINFLLGDDPEKDEIVALVHAEAAGEQIQPEQRQSLARVRRALSLYWPEYGELVAQTARRRELLPLVAFRRFVVGWEGPEVPFSRGRDGFVSDAAMQQLNSTDIIGAGAHAYGLLYAGDQKRNFPQPSPSAEAPPTSTSTLQPPADGSSKASGGKKTRAASSRSGSSAS